MKEAIQKLHKAMERDGMDAVLVTGLPNVRYLSGFTCTAEGDGILLITKDKHLLISDFRYVFQAAIQAPDFTYVDMDGMTLCKRALTIMKDLGVKTCAFEEYFMTMANFACFQNETVEMKPWQAELNLLRKVKNEAEIRAMQKAQDMADKSYTMLLERVHSGMTEKEVAAELTYLGAKCGSEGPSFDPIIAAGENGAMCHAIPSDRKLKEGDLVVVDYGCIADGYHSDTTRTFAVGNISEECRKIYDIVRQAQKKALETLRPGISGIELDASARDLITAAGYGKEFGHSLGHGVGLEIHEAPSASYRSKDTLLPGMTITIEPGIYVEGLCGVRIEDCCVLTETGYIDYTHLPKDLVTVG